MADLYEVLGVPPTADARDVRRAYLRLAQQYHPDRDSRPEAVAKFLEVQTAYEELGDAVKRQRYDARRKGAPSVSTPPPPGPVGDVLRAVREALRQRGPAGAGQEQPRTLHLGNVRVSVKLRTS